MTRLTATDRARARARAPRNFSRANRSRIAKNFRERRELLRATELELQPAAAEEN